MKKQICLLMIISLLLLTLCACFSNNGGNTDSDVNGGASSTDEYEFSGGNSDKEEATHEKVFSIAGKWKNIGEYTFGQVQKDAIIIFDGVNCNVYSPKDTYAFYKDGDNYKLDCSSFLFGEKLSFTVKVTDDDHIQIYNGADYLELMRVQ